MTLAGRLRGLKSVFVSQSDDVFANLALHRWLYDHFDFRRQHVLMLWRASPCVTVGLRDNPWNTTIAGAAPLARRESGGEAIYHDDGNLNMTFFAPTDACDHKQNLEIVVRALFRKYGLKLSISSKEGLFLRNSKIAHSAVKWGPSNMYHHCFLNIRLNKVNSTETLLNKNAPHSSKHRIANLCEESPQATVDGVLSAVGWEYLRTASHSMVDGGKELANCQNGFQMVNPTEQWFPGLSKIRENLTSWEWCYGKTPGFIVTKPFNLSFDDYEDVNDNLEIKLYVEEGIINNVELFAESGSTVVDFNGKAKIIEFLKGQRYTDEIIKSLEWSLRGSECSLLDDKDKFDTDHRRIVTSG